MKCLFRDDKPSEETMMERSNRKKLIMLRQVSAMDFNLMEADNMEGHQVSIGTLAGGHILRDLKSKKRLMRKAARIFNQEASRGIEFLVDAGLVPDPLTPSVVASFLRNSIVVGLDKRATGAYLGEAGNAPAAGKSPPSCERNECLEVYCCLFA